MDADDDGDGVLTIDEDYNQNGNPADDDTNLDGIPDYRQASVALSVTENEKAGFMIYPNPASTAITINQTENGNVVIYNVVGQRMGEFKTNPNLETTIDISDYASGMYFIHFNAEGKKAVQKFLKN